MLKVNRKLFTNTVKNLLVAQPKFFYCPSQFYLYKKNDVNETSISTGSSPFSIENFNCRNYYNAKREFNQRLSEKKPFMASLVENSPKSIQPYMKLMRIHQPTGSWLLFWPCAWSIAMAAEAGSLPDVSLLALFGAGAFIMRGAGCTFNDLMDRDIDSKVMRTKDRPLVTGEVTPFKAFVFLGGQLSIGLLILLQLNWYSICLGALTLPLVKAYPFMKRVTYWPQLLLGFTFNWGALLGWSAVHGTCSWSVCLPLYVGGIFWTLFYDTIYAHQDVNEDILLGVKSTAIKFGPNTKKYLTGFGSAMIASFALAGYNCDQSLAYYIALGGVGTHLLGQVISLKIYDSKDCWKKFNSNTLLGLFIFGGIMLGSFLKPTKYKTKSKVNKDMTPM